MNTKRKNITKGNSNRNGRVNGDWKPKALWNDKTIKENKYKQNVPNQYLASRFLRLTLVSQADHQQ